MNKIYYILFFVFTVFTSNSYIELPHDCTRCESECQTDDNCEEKCCFSVQEVIVTESDFVISSLNDWYNSFEAWEGISFKTDALLKRFQLRKSLPLFKHQKHSSTRIQALYCNFLFYG